MSKLHSIALGGAFALGLIGMAHAADATVAGSWKLTVGKADAPCTLTLADGGDVTNAGNCTNGGDNVGHWKAVGTGVQLSSNSGELIAWLHPKGDGYDGKRVADGRELALAH
jgi:hypothetical protein